MFGGYDAGQEDQGPQASHRHRYTRPAGRPDRARSRYPGPRRRARGPQIDPSSLPRLRHLFADAAYAGPKLEGALEDIGRWKLEIIKRSDTAQGFELLPRRWVVERTIVSRGVV